MYLGLWNEMGHAFRQFDTFSNSLSFQPSQAIQIKFCYLVNTEYRKVECSFLFFLEITGQSS